MNEQNKDQIQEEKEKRRLLYETNKEEYKKQRNQMKRGFSKNFRNINQSKKEENQYLDENTYLALNSEENGVDNEE